MTTIIVTDVLTITFCLLEYTVVPLYSHTISFSETSDCKIQFVVVVKCFYNFIVKSTNGLLTT